MKKTNPAELDKKHYEIISCQKNTKNNLAVSKGKILRVKHGYNPNSSSMGSIIFAMPVALFGATIGFGVVSSIIMTFFTKKEDDNSDNE